MAANESTARAGDGSGTANRALVERLLTTAVDALGGTAREGQERMADAVAAAMAEQEHLLVQAGTGTGKSLAYLIPALVHARESGSPVVVATATLALQAQLVGRDLPMLVDAIAAQLGRRPTFAIYKGRGNYACLHRVRDGVPDDQGVLVDAAPSGPLGEQVVTLRSWVDEQAETGGDGDRDSAPVHQDRAWRQVSVSARECLGADSCPYGQECFAEQARAEAMAADVVVTNHALLAIDALENFHILPDYDTVVIDEAHELVARVTSTASAELAPGIVERAARRARPHCTGDEAAPMEDAVEALRAALSTAPLGRAEVLASELADAVALVRDSARAAWSAIPSEKGDKSDADTDASRRQARVAVDQVREVAERIAEMAAHDVVWVAERERGGPELRVAPLSVAGLLRERLFAKRTCVLTSATLRLGGDFDVLAGTVGLRTVDRISDAPQEPPANSPPGDPAGEPTATGATTAAESVVEPIPWRSLDVGSPFDYARQAILYVARRLPPPGRDGIGEPTLEELNRLVTAAGGRTLGLFSSRRAAEAAAAWLRERCELPILCQGESQLAELQRQFVAEPETSLFGTLSLWQGLDVPGDTCQLVVIDRIPFPRPDDPLMSARQRAADRAGGNGFMAVSAAHAALLLAQGVGRLIRRTSDRGVVAVLDPRLATARYGGFLRASLPPMWHTTDPDVVTGALRRLATTTSSD